MNRCGGLVVSMIAFYSSSNPSLSLKRTSFTWDRCDGLVG